MKVIFSIVLFLIGMLFFNYRYLAPEAGVHALSTDYGTHFSIEQHLKEGRLFPELEKSEKGLHAVSKYLPVYHGLLGFHFSALLLETIGVPLPGAYMLIMDFSLLVYLMFFLGSLHKEWKQEWRWDYLLAIVTTCTIFISNFAWAVEAAFFSQIFCYALLITGWYFWQRKKFWWSSFFFAFALFTYPDFLLWLIPFLVFGKSVRVHTFFRIALSCVWIGLIYTLFQRRNLLGPEAVSLYPLLFLPLVIGLFWKPLHRERREFLFLLLSYSIVTIGFLLISHRNFTWSYYALKLTYPAVFFLIYIFIKVPLVGTYRGRFIVALYVFFFWSFSDLNWMAVAHYFSRSEVVNNKFYAWMLETQKNIEVLKLDCSPTHTLVLPSRTDVSEANSRLEVWARNSLLLNSDISSGTFKDSTFEKIYSSFANFEKSYNEQQGVSGGDQYLFSSLKKLTSRTQDICIVSDASKRSLFNGNPCFVILKEQGGQIYAQCKAQAGF